MANLTERFVDALHQLHRSRDTGPLVELFDDGATLTKVGVPQGQHGKSGADTFWTQYRNVFDEVDATFRHEVTQDGVVFLEWTSQGTLADGTDFRYDGVSVLEGHDTIDAFRTYYDTAAFLTREGR